MTSISIIGRGKMGSAIANIAELAGAHVQIVNRSATPSKDHPHATYSVLGDDLTGDLVVFAIPYGAYSSILGHYRNRLGGKVVIDISNPIDFTTYEQPAALLLDEGLPAQAEAIEMRLVRVEQVAAALVAERPQAGGQALGDGAQPQQARARGAAGRRGRAGRDGCPAADVKDGSP